MFSVEGNSHRLTPAVGAILKDINLKQVTPHYEVSLYHTYDILSTTVTPL
jgi:hypothetical protein